MQPTQPTQPTVDVMAATALVTNVSIVIDTHLEVASTVTGAMLTTGRTASRCRVQQITTESTLTTIMAIGKHSRKSCSFRWYSVLETN